MDKVERIGVSLDKKLLVKFDSLIAKQGYKNRSEAIRDLVRQRLSSERLSDPKANAVAAVCLVYDHHAKMVPQKLIDLQHSNILQAISSLHVHLDQHDCLEVIVLRGPVGKINKVAEGLLSLKGVKLGKINLVATDAKHDA